jgi:K+-sensing histidine kinase KdpD
MGLGLSVSYGIIARYGCSIKARNRSPRGCGFEVLLTRVAGADLDLTRHELALEWRL